jgi:hypothetical protein
MWQDTDGAHLRTGVAQRANALVRVGVILGALIGLMIAFLPAPGVMASASQRAIPADTPVASPGAGTPTASTSATPASTPSGTPATTPTTSPATTPTTSPATTPAATPSATTTTTAQAAQVSATLAHIPVGEMSISFTQATKTARTTLNMTGMPPNTSAVGLVVAGSCDAPGGVLWRGATFSADPNGKVVNFKVKFSGVQGTNANAAVVIQTIAGNGETRDGYNLACGLIKSTRIGGPITQASVTFGPVPGAQDGNVTGSATLAQDSNKNLAVTVQASGLAPSSQHGVSINLGSCQWLSYVLYDLPQMTADASGNGSVTITINNAEPLPTAGGNTWYVAIDYQPQTNHDHFETVSCGNVPTV